MICGGTEMVPLARHFPVILHVAPALPLRIVDYFNPTLANYFRLIDVCFWRIRLHCAIEDIHQSMTHG